MKNKWFIRDLQRICSNLQYESSFKEGKDGMFCLYILSKSVPKLYQDYLLLLNEYPEIDLGIKGEKIKLCIGRLNKPKLYLPVNKERLVQELQVEPLTVGQIAEKLNMTRQGARYLLCELKKEDRVKEIYSNHIDHKYGVVRSC